MTISNEDKAAADNVGDIIFNRIKPLMDLIYSLTKETNSRVAKAVIEKTILPFLHEARKRAIEDKKKVIIQ